MSRRRPSGAGFPASTCRASSATWRNARRWRSPPSGSRSPPRSRRSTPARSRISPTAPPISTRSRAAGSASGSASRTRPSHIRMGVTPGKPLGDIRAFVEKFRSYEGIGALPPIVLAALRKRMVALSAEIAAGRHLRQCQPLAHGGVAVGDPGRKAPRPGVPGRQHDPDLHLGRRRGGQGGQPPHADPLHDAAELPQLLEGSRLCRGDGGDRDRARRGPAERHPVA